MIDERRKNPRRKPEQLLYVEFGRENGGMIRDLSESGFGFRSVGPLQRGEKVPFSFAFPGGDLLRGEAELVWTEEGRSGGLLFVNVSEEVRRRLRTWCARATSEPNVPTARGGTASTASTFEELRDELRSQISAPRAGTSIAVAEMPASREKSPPVSSVAEVAEVAGKAVSREAMAREAPFSAGPSLPAIFNETIEEEAVPAVPIRQAPPPPPPAIEHRAVGNATPLPREHAATHQLPTLPTAEPQPDDPHSPSARPSNLSIGPLAFDREINVGLASQPILQGSLTGPSWVENVTVSWVIAAMLILTLVAAGIVFHNEVGEAFIWLGAKIARPETAVQQPAPQSTSGPSTGTSGTGQAENRTIDNPAIATPAPDTPHTTAPAPLAAAKPVISPEKQKNQAAPLSLLRSSPSNSKGQPATPRGASGLADGQGVSPGLGADNPVNASPSSASASDDENGQNALQQAMQILNSDKRSSDISEAVRLLWIAVEHGSSEAEVVLADLYRTGEGVAQSCDQTHILLIAAGRKGNNEAKSRLVEIAHTGCP